MGWSLGAVNQGILSRERRRTMFNNPLEELSLSAASQPSCRPAVEALEERVALAAVTPAVFLATQEVVIAFQDLISLQLNPTRQQAIVVLTNESVLETQHLVAHQLDQFFMAQGINDAPFQQLDGIFHFLDSLAVARAEQILAGG
jgi:hypothetical protein